jgi:hypothetical protein
MCDWYCPDCHRLVELNCHARCELCDGDHVTFNHVPIVPKPPSGIEKEFLERELSDFLDQNPMNK